MDIVKPEDSPISEIAHLHTAPDGSPILRGGRCTECGAAYFPPIGVCPVCSAEDQAEEDLPRSGTLYVETIVHVAPRPWSAPYSVGYVDLSNGVRIFSHLEGRPAIGDTVTLTTGVVGTEADGAPIRAFVFMKGDD